MGCSAAKNMTVEPIGDPKAIHSIQNGKAPKVTVASNGPPLESDETQVEILDLSAVNNVQKGTSGLSFEINFEDEDEDNATKKQPPKKFQKVEEEASTLTLEKLQEKLDEAEIRRQQILQQRVQSAKVRNLLKKQSTVTSLTDNDPDRLNVPPDIPQPTNAMDVGYV